MTNGMTSLGFAVSTGHRPSVVVLLEAGAGIDVPDRQNRTALEVAAVRGNEEIVLLLLSENAKTFAQTESGRPPLIAALEAQHPQVALVLLEAGAEASSRNAHDESALQIASEIAAPQVVAKLLELGAQESEHAGEQALNAAMQRLEGARPRDSQVASVSSSRSTRPRASLSTSEANDPDSTIDLYREIALSLVEAGANLDWTPDGGKSAREIAVWLGFDELIEARDKASKAR